MSCCWVCGKTQEELGTKLLRCSRCKSSTYLLCGQDCQRKDWKRHKREDCSSAAPGAHGQVSEFFNGLSMMRGKPEVKKCTGDGFVPLTEEEYAQIAYPHPQITFAGAFGITDFLWGCQTIPQTFNAPDGKAFTVRQLAEAFAKAEEHNKDARHCFFEGFVRHKNPHTFLAIFGS